MRRVPLHRFAPADPKPMTPTPNRKRLLRALVVAIVLQLGAILAMPATAAEISVCPIGCDHTSINAAISAAEMGDIIMLRDGITYTEQLNIAKGITIQGPGPDSLATIEGRGTSSTIAIVTAAPVALRYVRITGGAGTAIGEDRYGGGVYINHASAKVTIDSSWIVSNTVYGDGGGIYVDAGRLDLLDSKLSKNTATLNGGGIFNDEGGVLNVERTEIFNNAAVYWTDPVEALSNAGGVFNRAEATISSSWIHDNRATTSGGGVTNRGRGEITLRDTIIERNHTLDGGGIFNGNVLVMEGGGLVDNRAEEIGGGISNIGIATLSGLTIDGNQADTGGGVATRKGSAPRQDGEVTISGCSMIGNVAASGSGRGGAIFAERDGDVTVELCTISGNEATFGAAMAEVDGQIEVSHSTIANNRTRGADVAIIDATRTGSIRFGNTFIHNPEMTNCSTRMATLGHNLDGDGTCEMTRTGDLAPRSVSIEALADNGGPSRTHALPADSPAIDAGHPGICPDHDQRGFAAPVDGNGDGTALCDIGAFEYGASAEGVTPTPTTPTTSTTPTPATTEPTPPPDRTDTPGTLGNPIYLPWVNKGSS